MRKINFLLLLLQCLSAATAQQLKPRPGQSGIFGHHLLETKNYDKAIELYRQYLKSGDNANGLIKSLKDDFEYFRNAGFDHSVIKKASETLSL
jgi:hypothetical protein